MGCQRVTCENIMFNVIRHSISMAFIYNQIFVSDCLLAVHKLFSFVGTERRYSVTRIIRVNFANVSNEYRSSIRVKVQNV